jgi:hypothetical protein
MTLNVFDILQKVYGARGIPFPNAPLQGEGSAIANGFNYVSDSVQNERSGTGTPIKKYSDENLGQYVFMPVMIDGYELPNPLIIITGEKLVVETDILDVGTVFEKVFKKPYDVTIICTLVGEQKVWPEKELKEVVALWNKEGLVTLKCALTDVFLQPKENLLITKISILDNEGAENVEVIQIDGRSNLDFQLEIL